MRDTRDRRNIEDRAVAEAPSERDYPVHDLLRRRWSPRAFAEQPVEWEKLRSVLEAARWAPSAFNEQPWRFIVATREQPEVYERVASVLMEGNRRWAQDAPVFLLSLARVERERDGAPNRHALHDVGMAVGNLITQATSLGLYVHQMAGFDAERARAAFGIPAEFEPVAVLALGYLGDAERLPEDLKERERAPRTRKPLSEIAFGGRWGESALPEAA
jgi:nitroreductase